jgi:hypothetical protein
METDENRPHGLRKDQGGAGEGKGNRTVPLLPILLVLGVFIVYNANLRVLRSSDTWPTELLPLSILKEGDFDLSEFPFLKTTAAHSVVEAKGRLLSKSPVLSALLAVPFYIPYVLLEDALDPNLIPYISKLASTFFTALSALFVFLAARRIAGERAAFGVFAAYAFGSGAWTFSQGLWQHPAGQLFLSIGLYLAFRGLREERYLLWAGLPLGLATVVRPIFGIPAAAFGLFTLTRVPRRFPWFCLASAGPLALLLAYNAAFFGSPFAVGYGKEALGGWSGDFFAGLAGLLMSPSRGLIVYSPVFALALPGLFYGTRREERGFFFTLGGTVVLHILLIAKWHVWYGGYCFGYRMLVDILPPLALLLALYLRRFGERPAGKAIFGLLLSLSIFIQIVGVYACDLSWHRRYDGGPEDPRWLWSIRNSQLVYYVKRGRLYQGKVACRPRFRIVVDEFGFR